MLGPKRSGPNVLLAPGAHSSGLWDVAQEGVVRLARKGAVAAGEEDGEGTKVSMPQYAQPAADIQSWRG